ncbi:P-loop NTPase [Maritalea sp.]|uniref:nucleotide-binding protein n=1 Tax=Maritalea sp. TaxID=2003361 RepID=UPI003EF74B60
MIIAVVSQKGGVGKSALSRFLAVEFAKSGWSVKIADLDTGQGSSTNWKARRDQNAIKPEVPVEKYATVSRAVQDAERYELMILDGPAFAEKRGLQMAEYADLVVIPTSYSLDDLQPQVETAQHLEVAGIDPEKIKFIFCKADGSDTEEASARSYLKRAGMNVLKNLMPERASIRHASNNGQSASEVPHRTVRERIIPLAVEIANIIIPKIPDIEEPQVHTTIEPTRETACATH